MSAFYAPAERTIEVSDFQLIHDLPFGGFIIRNSSLSIEPTKNWRSPSFLSDRNKDQCNCLYKPWNCEERSEIRQDKCIEDLKPLWLALPKFARATFNETGWENVPNHKACPSMTSLEHVQVGHEVQLWQLHCWGRWQQFDHPVQGKQKIQQEDSNTLADMIIGLGSTERRLRFVATL